MVIATKLIGDSLRSGERRYGETYKQAVEATGFAEKTLRNAKWLAERYSELSLRRDNLSFTHHRAEAEREGWSVRRLARAPESLL